MSPCPKCNQNTVYYQESYRNSNANVCLNCGISHEPGSVRQSLERQMTGKNEKYKIGDANAQFTEESND